MGSGLIFCLLLLDATAALGIVWVGHIWYHVNIATSLGASLPRVFQFAKGLVGVTLLAWPVAYGLTWLEPWVASIIFSLSVFVMSLMILVAPQITSNSLLVV